MVYIVLIGVPALMVIGGVYVYKAISRPYFFLLLFTTLTIFMAVPFTLFKIHEKNRMLGVVPGALQATSISYNKEESWGFGPGGNEVGIRVFPLPEQVANEISRQGISFFHGLPPNRNQYTNWSQTPINPGHPWDRDKEAGKMDIDDYICAYGFCIDIDHTITKQATEIINSKGSYYAYGRIGLIIVSPDKKMVLYMYRG